MKHAWLQMIKIVDVIFAINGFVYQFAVLIFCLR